MDFDRWLQRFVNRMEKILFRGALLLIVFLFIVQALMTEKNMRLFFSATEQLEGKPLAEDAQQAFGRSIAGEKKYFLVIEAVYPPGNDQNLAILQNGQFSAELAGEPLSLAVAPGDMLEIGGTIAGGSPAVVRITEVGGKLSQPLPGHEIVTFGERELLAWIIP